MDRYLQICLFIILVNFSSSIITSQITIAVGYAPNTPVSQSKAALVNQTSNLEAAAGCTTYQNGTQNCQGATQGLTGSSGPLSGLFQYVVFVGDWLGGLGLFIKYMTLGLLTPGQILGQQPYNLPDLANSGNIGIPDAITAGMYFVYFLFVILFLRGGRTF